MIGFDITDWYYVVGNSNPGTNVWSTRRGISLTNTDAGFLIWMNALDPAKLIAGGNYTATLNIGFGNIQVNCGSTQDFTSGEQLHWIGNNSGDAGTVQVTVFSPTAFILQSTTWTVDDTSGSLYGATFVDTSASLFSLLNAAALANWNNVSNFQAITSSSNVALTNPMARVTQITLTGGATTVTLPQMNVPNSVPTGQPVRLIFSSDADLWLFGAGAATQHFHAGDVVDIIPQGFSAAQGGVLDLVTFPQALNQPTVHQVLAGPTSGGAANATYRQLASTDMSDVPIPVSSGGTGDTTLTAHSVLLGEGSSAVAFATIGTAGRVLIDQGTSADPSFNAISGDGTLTSAGALTVTKTNGVAFAASATTNTTNAANITSGTLPAARLPNPSASTLGGVESFAAVSHEWINTISTSGVPSATQPASTDLSDIPIPVSSGGTGDTGSAWTAFSPTFSAQTGTLTTVTNNNCRYKQMGKTVWVNYDFTLTNIGTASGRLFATSPVTPHSAYALLGDEIANTAKGVAGLYGAGINPTGLTFVFVDATNVIATGNRLVLSGVFEST